MLKVAVLALSAVLLLVAGIFLGGGAETTPLGSSSWRALNEALYTRRGKVYRFFPNCESRGREGRNGCFVALPVYEQ